jgi:hypothetical protein
VYGVLLIAMLFLMPQGAGGFLYGIWLRLTAGRQQAGVAMETVASAPGGHEVPQTRLEAPGSPVATALDKEPDAMQVQGRTRS